MHTFFVYMTLFAAGVQLLIDATPSNLACIALTAATFLIACGAVFEPSNSANGRQFPTTVTFLAVAANSLVPLVSTALEWRPLTYKLASPVDTYVHCSLFGLMMLLANGLALHFDLTGAKRFRIKSLLHIRDVLTSSQVFYVALLGFLTLALRVVATSFLPQISLKLLEGASFLALAVFVLAMPPRHLVTFARPDRVILLVGCWLLFAATGITSRKAIIIPIAVVIFGWFMSRAFQRTPISRRTLNTLFLMAPMALIAVSQATALSEAILVERGHRKQRSLFENLSATLSTFMDADKLQRYREYRENRLLPSSMQWREDYIGNPFAARFSTVKQCDNLLTAMKRRYRLEPTRQVVLEDTWARVAAQFPGPIFDLFFPHLDKVKINASSMGDVMAYQFGLISEDRLGSKLTGSAAAHSFLTLGWWYPLTLLPLYFAFFTCLSAIGKATGVSGEVSTLSQIVVFDIFTSMNIEGWHNAVCFLVRGFWQILLIYAAAVAVARMLAGSKQPRVAIGVEA